MPSKTTIPKLSKANLYHLLSKLPGIRTSLTHKWGGQTINTNNKFPNGICGSEKYGTIICELSNVTLGVNWWVRLKIYAAPKKHHTEKVEMDYVLVSQKDQKVQLGTDGQATFDVHTIKKHTQQTHTDSLLRFDLLDFFLGVELLDEDDNVLVESIDDERPFFVISSTYNQQQPTAPIKKRANKRRKVTKVKNQHFTRPSRRDSPVPLSPPSPPSEPASPVPLSPPSPPASPVTLSPPSPPTYPVPLSPPPTRASPGKRKRPSTSNSTIKKNSKVSGEKEEEGEDSAPNSPFCPFDHSHSPSPSGDQTSPSTRASPTKRKRLSISNSATNPSKKNSKILGTKEEEREDSAPNSPFRPFDHSRSPSPSGDQTSSSTPSSPVPRASTTKRKRPSTSNSTTSPPKKNSKVSGKKEEEEKGRKAHNSPFRPFDHSRSPSPSSSPLGNQTSLSQTSSPLPSSPSLPPSLLSPPAYPVPLPDPLMQVAFGDMIIASADDAWFDIMSKLPSPSPFPSSLFPLISPLDILVD